MNYKFEELEVWQLSLELNDKIYQISSFLPETEKFNMRTQINRAVTSVSLNIAEGSTSQTDSEQNRFLSYSLRSLIEVIACLRLIERRKYLTDNDLYIETEKTIQQLFIKLQAFRKALR
jgi:four helix bundle protein